MFIYWTAYNCTLYTVFQERVNRSYMKIPLGQLNAKFSWSDSPYLITIVKFRHADDATKQIQFCPSDYHRKDKSSYFPLKSLATFSKFSFLVTCRITFRRIFIRKY